MSDKKQEKKVQPKRTLADRIEKIVEPDTEHLEPEEFVPPLLDEISKGVELPQFSLSDPSSAAQAAELLQKKLQELRGYQGRVRQLKQVLENRKFSLESQDD